MSLLLHGRFGTAHSAAPRGLLDGLTQQVGAGSVPPFGFVAVDGGPSSYWQADRTGDDPMAMLLDEVPRWLRERGLAGSDGTPFAVAGTSMGGFGALLYARRRRERRKPVEAIGTIAPALMTSWTRMRKRGAFTSEAEWAELDPLHNLDATRGIPTAVWCGTSDPFIVGVRQFVARARPALVRISEGGHTSDFFSSTVPELVRFLGSHVPNAGPD
ncbi:alpha/beta hydrolase [Prauserella oleivorans]